MFLIRLALKNLSRHKKRTILTAGVIAVAILFYIFLDSLLMGMMDKSFASIINFESGHLQIVDEKYWEEKEELPLENLIPWDNSELQNKIRNVKGFQAMSPELVFSANLNNGIDELPAKVKGIIPEEEKKVFSTQKYLLSGTMFASGEYKAVLGKELAEMMDLNLNDFITLLVRTADGAFNTIDVQISGLFQTPNPGVNQNVIYVPLDIAQQALNTGQKASQIVVRLADREAAVAAAEELSSKLSPPLNAYSWRELAESVLNMNRAQQVENQVVLGIILLIAAVGIINTVILAALERMEEIGMMKALGLKDREIVFSFVLESTGIGIIGGIIGCILGGLLVAYIYFYGIDLMALTGSDLSSYGIPIAGRIYGSYNPRAIINVLSFSIIVTTLISILPSYWAARMDPVEAIYHR